MGIIFFYSCCSLLSLPHSVSLPHALLIICCSLSSLYPLQFQVGICRLNCLDSLDRTNELQFHLHRAFALRFLRLLPAAFSIDPTLDEQARISFSFDLDITLDGQQVPPDRIDIQLSPATLKDYREGTGGRERDRERDGDRARDTERQRQRDRERQRQRDRERDRDRQRDR